MFFFFKKAKDADGYNFDPDTLNKPQHFCQIGKETIQYIKKHKIKKDEVKTKEIDVIGGNKGYSGHLPMATGIGKTTKFVNCVCNGGKRHVILVVPTRGLVESAVKHHTS